MAKKVLGQLNPSATTATTLYTVPSGKSAVISTLVIANLTTTAATYRIAVRVAGATLANSQYVAYDITVGASDSTALTLGITLAATDVVTVYASTANLTFTAFGDEAQSMAASSLKTSSIVQKFPKYRSILVGNQYYFSSIPVDYLVVGAGGIGMGNAGYGGGSGAGGGTVKTGSAFDLSLGSTFTVTVAPTNSTSSTNGASSVFSTITALGGGYGLNGTPGISANGISGGNGGGAYVAGSITGTYTGGAGLDGYPGATVSNNGNMYGFVGGGGGGAGGAGSGKNAGPGVASSITGTTVYYGGGGNGSDFGGSGTTGNGATAYGTAGAANTGAGGGRGTGSAPYSFNGGSGIVVIAYPNTYPALTTIPGTLTYDQPTRTGYRVYRFTAGTGTVTV